MAQAAPDRPVRRGGRPPRQMTWTSICHPMPEAVWKRALPKLVEILKYNLERGLERGEFVEIDRGDYIEIVTLEEARTEREVSA